MRLVLFTQNIAPFREDWMNELSTAFDICIYHLGEYEKDVDPAYLSYQSKKKIDINSVARPFLTKFKLYNFKQIHISKNDLILLDGYGFTAQLVLILHLKSHHVKYGMSVDGGILDAGESVIKRCIKSFFIKGADFYFSTSALTDAFLFHYGVKPKQIMRHRFSSVHEQDILDDIPSADEKQALRKKLGIRECKTVISVGKFIPRKGFDILLKAAAMLKGPANVLIVGGIPDEEFMNNYRFPENVKIYIVGFADKTLLSQYYAASDIFALPTREDIWGLVVGEAMAKGLPIVSSDRCVSSLSMIDSSRGIILDTLDHTAWAKTLNLLLNDSARCQQMGRNCLSYIHQYSIEQASKDDIVLLEKYLSNKEGRDA